jgi:hypothetical protein
MQGHATCGQTSNRIKTAFTQAPPSLYIYVSWLISLETNPETILIWVDAWNYIRGARHCNIPALETLHQGTRPINEWIYLLTFSRDSNRLMDLLAIEIKWMRPNPGDVRKVPGEGAIYQLQLESPSLPPPWVPNCVQRLSIHSIPLSFFHPFFTLRLWSF